MTREDLVDGLRDLFDVHGFEAMLKAAQDAVADSKTLSRVISALGVSEGCSVVAAAESAALAEQNAASHDPREATPAELAELEARRSEVGDLRGELSVLQGDFEFERGAAIQLRADLRAAHAALKEIRKAAKAAALAAKEVAL